VSAVVTGHATPAIAFRPCNADDADAAVPLIISSGPAAFDYIFADRSPEQTSPFVARAFRDDGMELGHSVHTAMLLEGHLAAVGALWHAGNALPFMLAGARQIYRHYGPVAGTRVVLRGLRMETVVKPPRKGVAYLGHFGVAPELRGQGLGTLLIHHLIEQARSQGFTVVALDVSSGNPRAQKLYEQLGFAVKKTNAADYRRAFGHIVDHRYMELAI
jgi:ribosomal protein S18 acetylase RimI-like enzyme